VVVVDLTLNRQELFALYLKERAKAEEEGRD
jgi:hypothetical protein